MRRTHAQERYSERERQCREAEQQKKQEAAARERELKAGHVRQRRQQQLAAQQCALEKDLHLHLLVSFTCMCVYIRHVCMYACMFVCMYV